MKGGCMAPSPEVSVIIPTRNRWHLLSRSALPAARMQEDVALEIVVVDDGSTDETRARLATLSDDGVRVVRNDVSRGVSAARNAGIRAARGAWLAFLDDDDIWEPRKLRAQIDAALKERAGFAFSSAVTVDRRRRPTAYRHVPAGDDLVRLLAREDVVPGGCSNVVARADVVRRLGGFDEGLSLLADWDLWLRLALETAGARCPEIHVGYLEHGGNMALRAPTQVVRESKYFAAKHRESTAAHAPLDRLAPVRWVAWANFWAGHRARAARLLMGAALAERSWRDLSRGVRFLIWATAPERLSQALWRVRHVRTAAERGDDSRMPPPEWLSRYDAIDFELA